MDEYKKHHKYDKQMLHVHVTFVYHIYISLMANLPNLNSSYRSVFRNIFMKAYTIGIQKP